MRLRPAGGMAGLANASITRKIAANGGHEGRPIMGEIMMLRNLFAAGLALATLAACNPRIAEPNMGPVHQSRYAYGHESVLAGPDGRVLYTFARDQAGKSVCNGQCAQNWPPLLVTNNGRPTGGWTIVTRDDGAKQWAYKGRPLYYFAQDRGPGEVNGHGRLEGAWAVAKP